MRVTVAALVVFAASVPTGPVAANADVARDWIEAQLFAVRNDFARPPVHARNLYHLAGAMYDAWALFDENAASLFLDSGIHRDCAMDPWTRTVLERLEPSRAATLRERVIAQAAWRLVRYRYRRAVGAAAIRAHVDALALRQGLVDPLAVEALDDASATIAARPGDAAAVLGAQIADCVIGTGRRDNANEDGDYANLAYSAANPPLNPLVSGNPSIERPSRWQPLALGAFVDQAGKRSLATEFVGAEWADVLPFALDAQDRSTVERDGRAHTVYHDPGPPPRHDRDPALFAQNVARVAHWSAELDPNDPARIDPASRERTMRTAGTVPLGDYTRVIAEYWADGPDSETPPGHWFSLYNEHVARHPDLTRQVAGEGEPLDTVAFDVLAYLALGGAMHDAAIAAWASKAAYDYVRPISAIRFLAEQGGDDGSAALPLIPGRIERVEQGDPLAGPGGIDIGAIKMRGWRGPSAIADPTTDVAGVGWILARDWWPYQRPNFVTPPFAAYVSGHSAFSRAAAEVLERLTGTPHWPGGEAGFTAPANAFLVFERGPSVDVRLRWATYRDAADETGLSRIWGGIHVPVDDLAGRQMGALVGADAWRRARALMGPAAGALAAGSAPAVSPAAPIERSAAGCSGTGDTRGGDGTALLLLVGVAGAGVRRRRCSGARSQA